MVINYQPTNFFSNGTAFYINVLIRRPLKLIFPVFTQLFSKLAYSSPLTPKRKL